MSLEREIHAGNASGDRDSAAGYTERRLLCIPQLAYPNASLQELRLEAQIYPRRIHAP